MARSLSKAPVSGSVPALDTHLGRVIARAPGPTAANSQSRTGWTAPWPPPPQSDSARPLSAGGDLGPFIDFQFPIRRQADLEPRQRLGRRPAGYVAVLVEARAVAGTGEPRIGHAHDAEIG